MIEGMKRIGNIMSEVVEYSNMYESYKQVLRGTKGNSLSQASVLYRIRKEYLRNCPNLLRTGALKYLDTKI